MNMRLLDKHHKMNFKAGTASNREKFTDSFIINCLCTTRCSFAWAIDILFQYIMRSCLLSNYYREFTALALIVSPPHMIFFFTCWG